ncbi:hypothetical protein AAFF_G00083230 [Aldrovandia affinis]|uniref:Uncharacterized protein n=1 Tax=Aldrovandia affinis TaxID=143900 RepID=A0AAD7RXJ5_9TELE|nr:hypothetical protein AAFF_G00083230 [Aldrovandia affinis]
MPRRTRKGSLLNSKQPLLFVQTPLDGATHLYGPEVKSARNPKSFVSEEQRQSSAAFSSWVTPQFDTSMQLQLPAPRGRRGISKNRSSRSVLNSSSLLSLPQLRKTSVCKFPSLSFEKHVTTPPHHPAARHGEKTNLGGVPGDKNALDPAQRGRSQSRCGVGDTERPQSIPSLREVDVEDPGVSKVTPATPLAHTGGENHGPDGTINTPAKHNHSHSGFSPPDIETPEMLQGGRIGAMRDSHLSKLHLLFPQTPLQAAPTVLVSDTPEEHYGWSWRRRQLSFLPDEGQVPNAGPPVKSSP